MAIILLVSFSRAFTLLHYCVCNTATWEVGIESTGCTPLLAGPQFSVPFVLSCDTAVLGTMWVIASVTSMHAFDCDAFSGAVGFWSPADPTTRCVRIYLEIDMSFPWQHDSIWHGTLQHPNLLCSMNTVHRGQVGPHVAIWMRHRTVQQRTDRRYRL